MRNPKLLLLLSASLLLGACKPSTQALVVRDKPKPQTVTCDERCFVPCNEGLPFYDGDPKVAESNLVLSDNLRRSCDVRRNLCVECIQRARDLKAIQ